MGGREWWQRTANKEGGVKGEWISMKRDWQGLDADSAEYKVKEKLHRKEEREKRKEVIRRGKEREKEQTRSRKSHDGPPVQTSDPMVEEDVMGEPYTPELDEMP